MAKQAADTAGYGSRLEEALRRGPQPMSVRKLAREAQERYPDLDGTSYGGVRQYAEGNIARPRVDLLRAFADVLGVRADWLAFDDGAMTEEEEERERTRRERAESGGMHPERDIMDQFFDEIESHVADPRVSGDIVVYVAITEAMGRMLDIGMVPHGHPVSEEGDGRGVGRRLSGAGSMPVPSDIPEDKRGHWAVAVFIGRLVGAAFHSLPIDPHQLSDGEFRDYVTCTLQGVHRLADAARRHRGDMPELPPPVPRTDAGPPPDEPATGDTTTTED